MCEHQHASTQPCGLHTWVKPCNWAATAVYSQCIICALTRWCIVYPPHTTRQAATTPASFVSSAFSIVHTHVQMQFVALHMHQHDMYLCGASFPNQYTSAICGVADRVLEKPCVTGTLECSLRHNMFFLRA